MLHGAVHLPAARSEEGEGHDPGYPRLREDLWDDLLHLHSGHNTNININTRTAVVRTRTVIMTLSILYLFIYKK